MNAKIRSNYFVGVSLFAATLGVCLLPPLKNGVDLQTIKTVFYIAMENHNFTHPERSAARSKSRATPRLPISTAW